MEIEEMVKEKGEMEEMRMQEMKMRGMKMKGIKDFFFEEDGMGTVEVILIIVVLVGLVVIFRTQITSIVNGLFKKITDKTDPF